MSGNCRNNGYRRHGPPPPPPRGTIAASAPGINYQPNYQPTGYWATTTSGAMIPYAMSNQSFEIALRPPPPPPPQQMATLNSMETIQLILAAQAQQLQEHREELAREREANREFQRVEREANQAFQVSMLSVFLQSLAGSAQVAPAPEAAQVAVPAASPETAPEAEAIPTPPPEETTPSITEIVEQSETDGKRKYSSETTDSNELEEGELPSKRARKITPKAAAAAAAQANIKNRFKK